ncbi:MAG: peptidase [Pirellulales bacterium]
MRKCERRTAPRWLSRAACFGALLLGCVASPFPVVADTLTLRNGMQVRGAVAKVASLHENPNSSADPTAPTPVVFVDDQLRRTYFPSRQVRADGYVSENLQVEKIRIPKRVANGNKRIGAVGPVIKVEPFDKFGNRTYTMQTGTGPFTVIQGITEVSPLYTKVEGLQVEGAVEWDMRIATNSVPRDILSSVMKRAVKADNPDQRLRIMRLYTQAERFEDARQELAEILRDFPALADLKKQERELLQLSAVRLIQEADLRRSVGQHLLAIDMLKNFPTEGIAGETLVRVRETLQEYDEQFKQGQEAVEALEKLVAGVEVNRERIEVLVREIKQDLNFNTLARLADFMRLSSADGLSRDQKISLAISGWLLGGGAGTDNLAVSLSLAEVRDLVGKYLRAKTPADRAEILRRMQSLEGASPANVAKLLSQMKPPLESELEGCADEKLPGLFKVSIPGIAEQAEFTYHVQLPPQYDPYRRYPCIVTLGNPSLGARGQMNWWTGRFDPKLGMHLGQAARQGYIVLAPEWTVEHQQRYEFSAREHAVVLSSLRDALRKFSIDTDRVYLSGHSMGGDAVWDIAFAHPDLWAGVVPVVASADKYLGRYWSNGRYIPMYFVCGELDADKMARNSEQFDRYMKFVGFDVMVTEYLGRGHEHFQEDQLRIFEWMGLHRREFFPKEFQCVSMRPWDNFFWYVEFRDFPKKTMVPPASWPPPRNTSVASFGGKLLENNGVNIDLGGAKATLWLAPEMVNFSNRVQVNGKGMNLSPSVETILEDVRTRGDRQHPFWAKVSL